MIGRWINQREKEMDVALSCGGPPGNGTDTLHDYQVSMTDDKWQMTNDKHHSEFVNGPSSAHMVIHASKLNMK